jgi:hypothetical protein
LQLKDLFLGETVDAAILNHGIQFFQIVDSQLDRLEIGQHSAKPALVYEEHSTPLCFFQNSIPGLLLGPYEKHALPGRYGFRDELVGTLKEPDGPLQINDVDSVSGAKNERLHLGIPASGLMPEVDSSFQQLFHSYNSHTNPPSG